MSYKLKIRYIYLPDRFTVILLIHSFIHSFIHSRPLVSNARLTLHFHCARSCAILLRECMSIWHHSLMSSNHSLLGLPLRVRPSMIPNTTPFTSPPSCRYVQTGWASSPRWVVQCSSCFQLVFAPPHLWFSDASECARFSCSTSFQTPTVNLCLSSSMSMSHKHTATHSAHISWLCWFWSLCWYACYSILS